VLEAVLGLPLRGRLALHVGSAAKAEALSLFD